MKKFHPFVLSLLSGLLLFAAWPVSPLSFLAFLGFVPLLWLADQEGLKRLPFFGWTWLTLLLWNIGTTWWVCNSTIPGGIAAIVANSLLMCIPWIGFYNVRKRMGERLAYPALLLFWLSFEYIHLNWELSWPWLTLGNVFATHPDWVQWYEYTGTSGGSAWVLAVNIVVFLLLRHKWETSILNLRYLLSALLLLILPLLCSLILLYAGHHSRTRQTGQHPIPAPSASANPAAPAAQAASPRNISAGTASDTTNGITNNITNDTANGTINGIAHGAANTSGISGIANIVVVQPNVDPWDEKFVAGKQEVQLQKLIRLSESKIDEQTALVIWPETAIPVQINENEVKTNYFMAPVWQFLQRHPKINLLTGLEGFRFFDAAHKTPHSSRIPDSDRFVETYNSALIMDSGDFRIYHKSKLVPGVETLPSFLHFLDAWFEKFGGTSGGYAPQEDRTVLSTFNHSWQVAPAVCYESIYGEFMSKYIHNGADLIAIITNDGWWGNTAGYRQHESYARLRAIETRRWIARSANTGISCFIDPYGKVIDPQPWDKTAVIRMEIPAGTEMTFYTRYGDILSRIAIAGALLLIGWNLVFIIRKRQKRA